MIPSPDTDLILAVVGTDHHRFDRLIDWLDAWLAIQDVPVRAVVQHGSSVAPRLAEGHALIPHADVQQLMRDATVVISHGGPATITEIRRLGKLPIVVPRDPARGEHVDGHQQRFTRRLGQMDRVVLCETESAFTAALDAARIDPGALTIDAEAGAGQKAVAETVDRVGHIIDDLIVRSRHRSR